MNPEAMDALHDLEKMEAQATCIKVEYVVEKHKEPYLDALKIIEVSEKGRLSDRDRSLSEMMKHITDACKLSRDMVKIVVLSDFQPDVHCTVEEILEHRMEATAEREQTHKVRVAELQEQHLRKPSVQARNVRREKREQIGKERAEYNRQKALEQAEIDAINNEERNLTTAYESSFNELDQSIRKDEAEIEQLMVQLGRVAVSTVSTIPTVSTVPTVPNVSTVPAVESSTGQPNAQVITEAAKGLPFCTVKMKIDDTLPELSGNLDDMTTYTGRLFQDVLANVNQSGENSSLQASSRSRSVSNKSRNSDLVPHQSVDQNDHSNVRSERSVRSNEPILIEASNNNAPTALAPASAPVFVAPSMPAPQINKRKESAPEQMTLSTLEPKRRTLENRPHESPRQSPQNMPRESPRQSFQETSRQSLRESPRKSPNEQQRQMHREVQRKSPQNEIGFTVRSRNDRSEPDLSLVKSEHPIQTSMGATPSEIVSELYSRRGNESSVFQPIATYGLRQAPDNRAGSFASSVQSTPKVSGLTSLQASKVPSSAQTPSTVPENRTNKKYADQPSASRPAQRDDGRGARSGSDNSGRFNEQSTFDDLSFTEHSFGAMNTGNRNEQPGTSRSAQRDGNRGFQSSGAGSSFDDFSGFGDDSFDRSHKAASAAKPGEKQSKPFDGDQSFGGFTTFSDGDAGGFDASALDANFETADFAGGFGFDD